MKNRAKKRPKKSRFEINTAVPYKTRRHSSSVGRINIRQKNKRLRNSRQKSNRFSKKSQNFKKELPKLRRKRRKLVETVTKCNRLEIADKKIRLTAKEKWSVKKFSKNRKKVTKNA